jgi:uncharacterized protein (DUF433 family)
MDIWKDCPIVQVDPERMHGEPTLRDYRLAVETLEQGYELGQTAEELASDYRVPIEDVRVIFEHIRKHQPLLVP